MNNPVIQEDLDAICASSVDWTALAGRTVLVTGASGMLPGYVARALLHAEATGRCPGLRVVALARDAARAERALGPWCAGRGTLVTLGQDVCDALPTDLQADYVVHGASAASPRRYLDDPTGTMLSNTVGTWRVLELARRCGSQGVLYLSSGAVYGLPVNDDPLIAEDRYGTLDPLDERSCYAEGKRAGEALCAAWWRQHGVRAVSARISHTYGPGMSLDDGRVFSDFVADILAGRDIVMKSAGTDARPFCYISDATRAFLMLLLGGRGGEAYNMGMDTETTIAELADTLIGLFPERGLRVSREHHEQPGAVRSSGVFDLRKIASLGWKPTIGLEEGFRRTVRYFELERDAAETGR